MALPRMRFLALGLTAAGLVAAGWLYAAEPPVTAPKPDAVPVQTLEPADRGDGSVRVDAPGTRVAVDKDSGKVSVTAPHTDVHVGPDKGRVQVRAPYVNLDIQW
jgi:multidrug efflux pump subunit AcrA (membrane-fusion protein)